MTWRSLINARGQVTGQRPCNLDKRESANLDKSWTRSQYASSIERIYKQFHGRGIAGDERGLTVFLRADDPHTPHGLLNSCDVPRSIFWITSVSNKGVRNASPWSFSGAVAYKPPQVFFAVTGSRKDGRPKDTLQNVRDTGEFVVNFPTFETREQMNITCEYVEPEVDEIELAKLATVPSTLVAPPGLECSPIRLECRLFETVTLMGNENTLVIGEVLGYHFKDGILVGDEVDWLAYKPLARLGRGNAYCVVNNALYMERPQ